MCDFSGSFVLPPSENIFNKDDYREPSPFEVIASAASDARKNRLNQEMKKNQSTNVISKVSYLDLLTISHPEQQN